MPESVKLRTQAMHVQPALRELTSLVMAIQADLELIRVQLNTHVHSGVTAGGANTAVPTTTIAQTALNTQP